MGGHTGITGITGLWNKVLSRGKLALKILSARYALAKLQLNFAAKKLPKMLGLGEPAIHPGGGDLKTLKINPHYR